MSDYRTADSLGERVKSLRKLRGISSAQDLVSLMPGSRITVATIENLESGRRQELGVGQLLNIAFALRTTPSFLLAALGRPNDPLDIANLTPGLASMTAIEFDAWISGSLDGAYTWNTAEELEDRNQLGALRELVKSQNELRRLKTIERVENELQPADSVSSSISEEVADAERRIERFERFLRSSGWPTESV